MPVRHAAGTRPEYFLLVLDKDGREVREADGSLLSEQILATLAHDNGITDVFLCSHGWKGDVGAAVRQYDAWTQTMNESQQDLALFRATDPGFKPLVIGLHWPSLPWGDETVPAPGLLGGEPARTEEATAPLSGKGDLTELTNAYAARVADTPSARDAITTVLAAPPVVEGGLPDEVTEAYQVLFRESGLGADGTAAAPGADLAGFDPQRIVDDLRTPAAGASLGVLGGVAGVRGALDLLRHPVDLVRQPLLQLSFWAMKDRGRRVGEGAGHTLLATLQEASTEVRLHVMGHSFGCIVATGAIAGPSEGARLPRPVHSLFLVQGAMSLWSFAPAVPSAGGAAGYFHRMLTEQRVRGPVVTTRTVFDRAVGTFYPAGAFLGDQRLLDRDLPPFGGLGTWGAQGVDASDQDIRDSHLDLQAGGVTNLEASGVICHGEGPSGAHSDIAHPEVARAFWRAAITGARAEL